MSLRDVSFFYVLGEDAAHRSFIRAWLAASGVTPHRVHTEEPPAGKSGGIQFVVSRFPEVARNALIRDRARAKTRVIVALDADEKTYAARDSDLKAALELAQVTSESLQIVCLLAPKRHIETWAHALSSDGPPGSIEADEARDYKPKTLDEVRAAARRLAQCTAEPRLPPSLAEAYRRLQELKKT